MQLKTARKKNCQAVYCFLHFFPASAHIFIVIVHGKYSSHIAFCLFSRSWRNHVWKFMSICMKIFCSLDGAMKESSEDDKLSSPSGESFVLGEQRRKLLDRSKILENEAKMKFSESRRDFPENHAKFSVKPNKIFFQSRKKLFAA